MKVYQVVEEVNGKVVDYGNILYSKLFSACKKAAEIVEDNSDIAFLTAEEKTTIANSLYDEVEEYGEATKTINNRRVIVFQWDVE